MGRRGISIAAAAAAATVAALAAPLVAAPARRPAAVARDWTRTVVATPEGGFRMGNPAARVKLVEYGSLTCGHCAHFAATGTPQLVARYVKTGRVSYEYRNYILNGLDVAASLVARCGGPNRFFQVADKFYATQGQWMNRVGSMSQAQKDQLNAAPETERLGRLADAIGLTQMAAQQGVAPALVKRCLADQASVDRLSAMAEDAASKGISGTPTFVINGTVAAVNTWPDIEPLIRSAAG